MRGGSNRYAVEKLVQAFATRIIYYEKYEAKRRDIDQAHLRDLASQEEISASASARIKIESGELKRALLSEIADQEEQWGVFLSEIALNTPH